MFFNFLFYKYTQTIHISNHKTNTKNISKKSLYLHPLRRIRWHCGNQHLSGTLCEQLSLIYKKIKSKVRVQKLKLLDCIEIVKIGTTNLWMTSFMMMLSTRRNSNVDFGWGKNYFYALLNMWKIDFLIFNKRLTQSVKKGFSTIKKIYNCNSSTSICIETRLLE